MRPGRAAPLVLPALGVLGLLVGLAALLAERGALLVHQCVGVGGGAAGWLGLRLALLRPDATCPSGTLAVGPDGRQALAVVVMVAVPALLAHLGAAAIGLGLARRARLVVGIALRLLRPRLRRRPAPVAVVLREVRRFVASRAGRPPGPVDVAAPLLRGPPLQLA